MPSLFNLDTVNDLLWDDAVAVPLGSEEWVNDVPGEWKYDLVFAEIDGRAECVGVAIVGDGTAPLTASGLRQLALGALVQDVRRRMAWGAKQASEPKWLLEDGTIGPLPDWVREPTERAAASFNAPRPRYPDSHYQNVADVYDEARRLGIHPTKWVQEKLGLNTRSQAAKQVARARERGLLPTTERRVAKGNPDDE